MNQELSKNEFFGTLNKFFGALIDKVLPRSDPEEMKYTRAVEIDGHVITYEFSYLYSPIDGEKHLVQAAIAVDGEEARCFSGQIASAVLDLMEKNATHPPQPEVICFLTAYKTVSQFFDKRGWHLTVRENYSKPRRQSVSAF